MLTTPVSVIKLGMVFEISTYLYRDLHNAIPGRPQLHANSSNAGTIIRLRLNLYRETAPVPFTSAVTGDYNSITSQFVPRPHQLSINFVP